MKFSCCSVEDISSDREPGKVSGRQNTASITRLAEPLLETRHGSREEQRTETQESKQ